MNQIIRASRSIWLTFDQIDVSEKARPYNATDVMALASSIRTLGLQVPITVIERGARYLLIAGRHRLEALRLVGADKVPCRIADLDDLDARLWTISENLHRNELTELQRAEQVEEWRTLAESKGAQVAHSSAFPEAQLSPASFPKGAQVGRPSGGAQPHNAGVSATARNLGVNRREVQRSAKIASITSEAKEAAHSAGLADNQAALLEVAAAPREAQIAAVATIAERGRAAQPSAKPLRNLEYISAGEFARWIKLTTPDNRLHIIRLLEMAAAILKAEQELEARDHG